MNMNIDRFKQLVNDNKENMTYLYIYYVLTVEENLKTDIANDKLKMEALLLLIENTYLYGDRRFDLAFICGVASDYVDEIFEENMDSNELDNLCSESFSNMLRSIDNEI